MRLSGKSPETLAAHTSKVRALRPPSPQVGRELLGPAQRSSKFFLSRTQHLCVKHPRADSRVRAKNIHLRTEQCRGEEYRYPGAQERLWDAVDIERRGLRAVDGPSAPAEYSSTLRVTSVRTLSFVQTAPQIAQDLPFLMIRETAHLLNRFCQHRAVWTDIRLCLIATGAERKAVLLGCFSAV
jgi:hypothetical protein